MDDLKVRRSVDRTWVVVLVESRLEGTASGVAGAARLVATGRSDGGASIHHVFVFIPVSIVLLATPDPPGNNCKTAEQDGATNSDDDTDDDVLLVVVETRV